MPVSSDLLTLLLLTVAAATVLGLLIGGISVMWRGKTAGSGTTSGPQRTSRAADTYWKRDEYEDRVRNAYFSKERRARALRERERVVRERTARSRSKHKPPPKDASPDPPYVMASEREYQFRTVLELEGEVTETSVRSAYMRLVAAYHPDKVAGLGAKLRDLAEEETKAINEAYTFFREHYGF